MLDGFGGDGNFFCAIGHHHVALMIEMSRRRRTGRRRRGKRRRRRRRRGEKSARLSDLPIWRGRVALTTVGWKTILAVLAATAAASAPLLQVQCQAYPDRDAYNDTARRGRRSWRCQRRSKTRK